MGTITTAIPTVFGGASSRDYNATGFKRPSTIMGVRQSGDSFKVLPPARDKTVGDGTES